MYQVGHFYEFIKFEFNGIRMASLYTKNDSERRRSVNLYY
ncbi:hypothetical protein FWK35_00038796 [Aphis craccivora]|uniref:Uncharacterized protein n=1 Tax=Aphis craccivora TaxID=307492 RepID=A0A6G0YFK7_APHCR|nr:hypothetical protein FWK35_00038796 [Aphis craccivora]